MAERGEAGPGRLAEVPELIAAIEACWRRSPCAARTREVRRSRRRSPAATCSSPRPDARADRSGALHRQPLVRQAGLRPSPPRPRRSAPRVTLVIGPGQRCPIRPASTVVRVETAREMLEAVRAALPADIAIFAAAVADWRVAHAAEREDQEGRQGARRSSSWSRTPTSSRPSPPSAAASARRW